MSSLNSMPRQRSAWAAALLALCSFASQAALHPGEVAPDIQLQASLNGKAYAYRLKTALQSGPVVVYFYPSAYTNGCNIQAHTFATQLDQFHKAGATVLGVSLDSIARLNEFSADPDYCAGRLSVASDVNGVVARAYDLQVREAQAHRKDSRGQEIDHGFAERTTFVITPDGRIAATLGGLTPTENVAKALQAVQQLASKAP